MPQGVLIPARFNGPLDSGNGGYSAGVVAGLLDGEVEVSLRSPVPLDKQLEAVIEDGSARLLDDGELIAEGRRLADFDLDVPEPVTPVEAAEAMRGYRGLPDGPFSRCFVCGRAREDALGVFAGPVEGRGLVASTWTPGASLADASGEVASEVVWAVLDCPTFFAAYLESEELPIAFLASLAGRVEAPVRAGEEHVVIAWPLGAEGRKRFAGSAVLSASGEVLACARALLIEPRSG
jgi:hypothetical protein